MSERRNFQRVPFATKAEINCNSNNYHGQLVNISLRGALVHAEGKIPLVKGNRCELIIHLLDSEITLQFETDIIYCQKNRLGFKFISEDLKTASHLRRLLELNIGSSKKIDREIASWLKEN
jgi:c-di-GMP-binding flagellar brake protein YcgR